MKHLVHENFEKLISPFTILPLLLGFPVVWQDQHWHSWLPFFWPERPSHRDVS